MNVGMESIKKSGAIMLKNIFKKKSEQIDSEKAVNYTKCILQLTAGKADFSISRELSLCMASILFDDEDEVHDGKVNIYI